jgi:hypothetical protein
MGRPMPILRLVRTRPLTPGLIAAAVLLWNGITHAQSELVIHKDGTKLYHRPGCPVVLDLAGVLAMTRAQAEARGYKAHPDCDPANPNAPAPRAAPPPPATVYVDGSKYYHRKDCSKLTDPKTVKAVSVEVAGKVQWPCPTCKPPVRRKSTENAVPRTKHRGS